MGVAEAIIISSIVAAGSAVIASQNKPGSPKIAKAGLTEEEKEGIKVERGVRAAILAGGKPEGILTPSKTSKSKLLGN